VAAGAFCRGSARCRLDKKRKNGKRKENLIYYELPVYAKSYQELERDLASGAYRNGQSIKILNGLKRFNSNFTAMISGMKSICGAGLLQERKPDKLPLLVRIDYMLGGEKKMFMYAIHVNSQIKRGYAGKYGQ